MRAHCAAVGTTTSARHAPRVRPMRGGRAPSLAVVVAGERHGSKHVPLLVCDAFVLYFCLYALARRACAAHALREIKKLLKTSFFNDFKSTKTNIKIINTSTATSISKIEGWWRAKRLHNRMNHGLGKRSIADVKVRAIRVTLNSQRLGILCV